MAEKHYRTRTGHNWPPDIRREPGEDVSDMPPADLKQELRDGTIEEYTPEPEPEPPAPKQRRAPEPPPAESEAPA